MSILKHSGLRALGTASVAACVLAACGGSGSANDALPLIRANVSIKAVSQGGVCETIPVRVTQTARPSRKGIGSSTRSRKTPARIDGSESRSITTGRRLESSRWTTRPT